MIRINPYYKHPVELKSYKDRLNGKIIQAIKLYPSAMTPENGGYKIYTNGKFSSFSRNTISIQEFENQYESMEIKNN